MTTNPTPLRGQVWQIRFDPAEGDEIKKTRTAVVISIASAIAICVGVP